MAERLRRLPAWRLAFAFITPLGLSVVWFVLYLRSGHTAWAVFFGILVAVSTAVIVAAVILKARARHHSS